MKTWVLLFFMTYDRSASITVIQNLASLQECQRVAVVVSNWQDRNTRSKCVEVWNSLPPPPKD